MSTNVPNLKQIGGGHRKNGQKFVDLMWNDPVVIIKCAHLTFKSLLFSLCIITYIMMYVTGVQLINTNSQDFLHSDEGPPVICGQYFKRPWPQ